MLAYLDIALRRPRMPIQASRHERVFRILPGRFDARDAILGTYLSAMVRVRHLGFMLG